MMPNLSQKMFVILKSAPCGQNGVYTQNVQNLVEMELNSDVEIVFMVTKQIAQARQSRAVFVIIKNVHDYRTGHIGQLTRGDEPTVCGREALCRPWPG